MMTEIVNLRLARKRKAREERDKAAVENRARHGRSRAEKEREAARRALEEARLRAHRLGVEDDR